MVWTRRDFLKASLGSSGAVALGSIVPAFLPSAARATHGPARKDTVLVVVQLTGGNDGLNTIIPYGDDAYARSRPTLRQPAEKLHVIDSYVAFHPQMQEFWRLFQEGLLAVVQGVGYPGSPRDHAAAMDDWQTAQPGQINRQTGWLGRAIDRLYEPEQAHVPGAFVGVIPQPFTLNAERAFVPTLWSLRELTLHQADGGPRAPQRQPRGSSDNPLVTFATHAEHRAATACSRVAQAAASGTRGPAADYPSSTLGQSLRTVSQLIRADLGIRIFGTELGGGGFGGFDNHANQAENHGALLKQLSEAVTAFVRDLKRDGTLDRVLLMTFSEFGRTVAENGRHGTGHGAAAPVFLAGGKVKGGLVGSHPSLTDLDAGALKVHTDFRRVYATALDRWLGIDSRSVLGGVYEPVDVLGT
jgi:uncharacterized protein (DUF1501 family)